MNYFESLSKWNSVHFDLKYISHRINATMRHCLMIIIIIDDSACIIHFNLRTRLQFAEAAPPFKSPLYMLDFKSPSAPLHMEEHLPSPCTTRPIYLPSSLIFIIIKVFPIKVFLIPFLWPTMMLMITMTPMLNILPLGTL